MNASSTCVERQARKRSSSRSSCGANGSKVVHRAKRLSKGMQGVQFWPCPHAVCFESKNIRILSTYRCPRCAVASQHVERGVGCGRVVCLALRPSLLRLLCRDPAVVLQICLRMFVLRASMHLRTLLVHVLKYSVSPCGCCNGAPDLSGARTARMFAEAATRRRS